MAAKPAKTEYTVGDTFSADGLKVVKVMSDKTEPEAVTGEYSLTAVDTSGAVVDLTKPFDKAATGKVTVTVTLNADKTKTATFEVTVKAKDETKPTDPENPTNPTNPTKPTKPTEPQNPAKPIEPGKKPGAQKPAGQQNVCPRPVPRWLAWPVRSRCCSPPVWP